MTYQHSEWQGVRAPTTFVGRVTPLDPGTYRASLRRLDLGPVVVEVMTTGPFRFDRDAVDPAAATNPKVVLIFVGDGSMDGVGDRTFSLRRGGVAITDDRHELHYIAEHDLRVMRVTVEIAMIPAYLLDVDPLPLKVIRRTTLVNSSLAFISALFARSDAEQSANDQSLNAYLREALIDLTAAILAEARSDAQREQDVVGDLRERIEQYTREHLTDPGLSPTVIARALGISVRYAHQVFNRDDTTLSRFIRESRLDHVAADLREHRSDLSFGELGARYGFGSRDQLARGFRQRFGKTMGQYRAEQDVGQGSGD